MKVEKNAIGIFNIPEHLQIFPNLKNIRVIKSDY